MPSEEQEWIWNNTGKGKSNVKGNNRVSYLRNVTYDNVEDYLGTKKTDSKDNISFKLAKVLDDLENLPYYEKLVAERRVDFLRNCLIIALNARDKGIITTTVAKYFTGVVKNRNAGIKRVRKWEERNKR